MSTAVILAGGESRRMKRDKLALPFGAATILASAVERFSSYFDKVYISVADPDKYSEIKAARLTDIYKGCGPMGGLHAALKSSEDEGVFLVAADLPYSDPLAAKRIIELAGESDICIMADSESRFEPLFGYYRKTVLPYVEMALTSGNYKLAALFDKIRLRVVTKEELGGLFTEKLLLNINYPEDYERLLRENEVLS
ncbi:MAG: molybdenum cofactor guanylyltransferase [Clostridiales bacterium]|nr:molybdenum cofactor guanylyltransferase [Clostridiales bacterium]